MTIAIFFTRNEKKSTFSALLRTYILFFLLLDKCPYIYSVYKIKGVKMERVMRIELTQSAWKAEVLPLNYTRIWAGREDRIWTCDLLVPNQALYQAKLLPVSVLQNLLYHKIFQLQVLFLKIFKIFIFRNKSLVF